MSNARVRCPYYCLFWSVSPSSPLTPIIVQNLSFSFASCISLCCICLRNRYKAFKNPFVFFFALFFFASPCVLKLCLEFLIFSPMRKLILLTLPQLYRISHHSLNIPPQSATLVLLVCFVNVFCLGIILNESWEKKIRGRKKYPPDLERLPPILKDDNLSSFPRWSS